MHGADVQRVFETILPDKLLMKLVESAKFQERTRKLDALRCCAPWSSPQPPGTEAGKLT
jgi:hypothetical protein